MSATVNCRVGSIDGCITIDPAYEFRYANTSNEALAAQHMRLENFLMRRNLYLQFYAEDAQGQR
jgi:hypothetical protein